MIYSPGFESSSGLTGTTTMDTTEAIISDLQQNISNNNGGKASRILKAKLKKATKSASRSRKNKVSILY